MKPSFESLRDSRWVPWIVSAGLVLLSLKMIGVGLSSQPAPAKAHAIARPASQKAPAESAVDISMNPNVPAVIHHLAKAGGGSLKGMALGTLAHFHTYTYVFEGQVTSHGRPCPQAGVLVRVNTPEHNYVQGGVADENGHYSISLPVEASADEPVDYVMNARDPASHQVELVGRRISAREEETVRVEKPLDIVVARLPKNP